MSNAPNLTPPIVEVPDKPETVDLDSVVAGLKAKRAELSRQIAAKIGKRAQLMTEITADRSEAKRLDRFIGAEKPRGSKPK